MVKIIKNTVWGIVLAALVCMGICEALAEDISKSVVRLHVVANSDDAVDQRIKYMVRDGVLQCAKACMGEGEWRLSDAELHRDVLQLAANDILEKQGAPYGARVVVGRFSFPTKEYENITLPAGEYDAVRVVLGDGKGQNWWCVLYPPLCFTKSAQGGISEEDKSRLYDEMGEGAYGVVSGTEVTIVPAVKAMEIWHAIKQEVQGWVRQEK